MFPVTLLSIMTEKIAAPLRAFSCFALLMYLLGLICLMTIHQGGRHVSVFELVVDVYVLCLILWLLPSKIALWTKRLFYVIAYGLTLIDLFCYSRFGAPINASLLRLFLETNQREATEAVTSYVTWSSISLPVILVLLLMAAHLLVSWRKIPIRIPIKGWLFSVVLLFCVAYSAMNKVYIVRNLLEPQTGLELEYAYDQPHDGGFYLPFYRLLYAWKGISIEQKAIQKVIRNINKAQVDSCSFRSPDIVLIIGEAYSKHHSQLYGYDKSTTPLQTQMMRDSSLVAFTNVITPYHQTSIVFQLTFSLYAYGQPGDWADYPLFPQLFKKAGFQVSFITNQFVPSPALDIYDFSGSMFVNQPQVSQSMFSHRNIHTHPFDMGILEDYDSLAQYRGEHNLTIFHLLGQHTAYRERYPEQERRFLPSDYPRKDLDEEALRELSDYDNACLYNDKVVTAITNRFKDKDAIVIYMPDHGEMCYDGSLTFGRTLEVTTPNEVYQQFEIPFWIWASPSYRQQHPDIWKQICKAKKQPFMTDNISQLLLYLAGIHCPYYQDRDNLISPHYQSSRKRMMMGTMDYDSLFHIRVSP